MSSARASSSVTREPSEPFVSDFQIPKRDFRGTPQVKDRGRSSHRGGRTDGQVEDGWRDQLSNDKVRVIAKFPEIPVGGRLSLFMNEWKKLQMTNGN